MRTRNALERLAAAGRPLFADAESLVDDGEQERILNRILASDRPVIRNRRPLAVVLVAAALVGAAIVAVVVGGHSNLVVPKTSGSQHAALSGARIEMAGYHFRTPAGFKASKSNCIPPPVAGEPQPAVDGFAAAAAADGACVEAAYLAAGDWLQSHAPIPDSAVAVDVGQYKGFYAAPADAGGTSTLYVDLPKADGSRVVYLVLLAHDVTEDELIAIAASGLPTLPPPGPTETTGTETTG